MSRPFLGLRVSREEMERLDRLAQATNRDRSKVVRELIRVATVAGPDLVARLEGKGERDGAR